MAVNDFIKVSQQAAIEGIVLLKNKDNVLPIKDTETVSLFGRCQIDYFKSGTGSGGAVNVSYSVNALEGIRNEQIHLNDELVSVYKKFIEDNPFDNGGGGWAQEPWFQKEMVVTKKLVQDAYKKSDKAIVFIGRTAGEDKDNVLEEGSYYLTIEEKTLLNTVTDIFEDVVVVFNVGNIIDMSYIDAFGDKIKGILYSWHGGQEGGNALAKILSGNVSPSGKLSGTIARHVNDYPSSSNFGNDLVNLYEEDIYVGYRYFETFNRKAVLYPFGYGLAYTTFQYTPICSQKNEREITIDVKVENTGEVEGKEVIQVYCESPQGKLGKPYLELIGFEKTNPLSKDESQTISFNIPMARLASYDDGGYTGHKSAYVLEEGIYNIYIGNNVRDINLALSFELEQLIIIEQLEEALAPIKDFKRMVPGKRLSSGEYEIRYQEVPKRTVDLKKRINDRLPKDIEYKGNLGISLQDVKNGKHSIEDFVSQLTVEEMALIIRGEGMSHPLVTPGTAAAFGGLYEETRKYGIPSACCADGPSGIRMDSGEKATQMPIGSLLACTWNISLMEQLYFHEGEELLENKIDTLLGPGLNIHRHPLNGRNFEYFSEDPLVSGLFSKASILGMRRGGSEGTLKHYAANDQEKQRNHIDAVASERCLREIHLKAFEIAVKEANARSIMTAYNPINGIQSASNYDLNTTLLRKEWGYQGVVMTDWWAIMNDNVDGGKSSRRFTSYMIQAQNDIFMVVPTHGGRRNQQQDNTVEAINAGNVSVGVLQRSVMNILNFILRSPSISRELEHVHTLDITPIQTDLEGIPFEEKYDINCIQNSSFWIGIDENGEYSLSVDTQYNDSPVAQSMMNVSINDIYIATIQMNGKGEKWINQHVGRVRLTQGNYEVKIFFKRPGLKVGTLRIKKV
jgi:beta-glucosidase